MAIGRACGTGATRILRASGPGAPKTRLPREQIGILLHSDSVQAGKGNLFKICSGVTTIEELAAVHEKVFGVKVDVTREGSVDDLEKELASLRKQKGRTGYGEYMSEAAALIASKGLWENTDVTEMDQYEKSAAQEEYFIEVKNKAQPVNESVPN